MALLVITSACSQDKSLAFARLLERAASWGASVEFAERLAQDGLVPRAYFDDLMTTASNELTMLASQIAKAEGVDDEAKQKAAASCSGLAALTGDAARTHGTPAESSIREHELQLRTIAQHTRAVDVRP